jgi:hypothetical protein
MRITIDVDAQTGQSNVTTSSMAAAAGQGGAINGGPASVAGGSTGTSLKGRALALPAQDGGAVRSGQTTGQNSAAAAQDGGTAPAETKH